MSGGRNCCAVSRCHARGSRSHGCSEGLEESERGGRDGYGRRGLGSRGGEKIGWGRQGAVRLDDPPLRRARGEMDDGLDSLEAISRMGGLGGQGGMDPFGRRGGIDPFGGFNGMGPLGGMGDVGGMGGRDSLGGPTMGRNSLGSPRSPMFNAHPPFAESPLQRLHQRNLFNPEAGIGSPLQNRFMGARQGFMDPLGIGMRSPSLRSGGSFDMRAMDRPRMPYGPFPGSPFQLQNQHPNYRPPYVEDYEGSEMEADLAAHQAAMQMQMMHGGGGGNPFFFDGQYGDGYGGMAPMMSGGLGSPMPGVGGGIVGGIH